MDLPWSGARQRDGYYVDVGSADGVYLSNTKLLDAMGWKGVCVDPFPKNMGTRTCQVFKVPVSSESGRHVSFRAADLLGGIESTMGGQYPERSAAPTVVLETSTLDEILTKARAPNYIDYMNIDVEGGELEALRGLSLDRYRVGAFTIEHNFESSKRESIRNLLEARGYVRVRSWEVDDWYVSKELAARYSGRVAYQSKFLDRF